MKSVLLFLILTSPLFTMAQTASSSPYFVADGVSAGSFPLQSTDVYATITGPIADVAVRQIYYNDSDVPIEATYVFPASTRAAVHGMAMRIGDRTIIADIKKKQDAKSAYEAAKSDGKRASLLEQHEANVFEMSVANILPGETIEVELKYSEFLVSQDQEYTFVFPTVVGPRYTGEQPSEWAAQPYTKSGIMPTSTFDITVMLDMPVPIHYLGSKAHAVTTTKLDEHRHQVVLGRRELDGGNRDFILAFTLTGSEIASGVMTGTFGGEQYFLCQVEPPEFCAEGYEVTPREYVFIIDVSGSMGGFPLGVSKTLMHNLLGDLKATDKFNILFFAGGNWMLSPTSLQATTANIQSAIAAVNRNTSGGGTNMLQAVQASMAQPKEVGYSRSYVFVTDGYVSVDRTAIDYVRDNLGDSNFFAFGIGSSVNRQLIEGLAVAGRGKPYIVLNEKVAPLVAERLRQYIQYPVLTDITIESTAQMYDLVYEDIPDLMAGRPIYFFGKYKGGQAPQFTVRGRQGAKEWSHHIVGDGQMAGASVLPYLWAREMIKSLDGMQHFGRDRDAENSITQLGLDFNLLTQYTSFVAVDSEVVTDGNPTHKAQPLPLPAGVPNQAVGFAMEVEDQILGSRTLDITVVDGNGSRWLAVEHVLEAILQRSGALAAILPSGEHTIVTGDTSTYRSESLRILVQELMALSLIADGDVFTIQIKQQQ